MSERALVIVESPAKAKTINAYLGNNFKVLASFGHVRDLPPKDGSVAPDDDFAMRWELSERAGKTMAEIKKELKNCDALILATDPDREGEAISWHLSEILKNDKALGSKPVRRVTFTEITKKAIKAAFDAPRDLDVHLIEAYLARRALDYLVGFNISPVLWRKLPGARSAGRVQSVALRLICERESDIERFKSQEYWTVRARLKTPDGAPFFARLTHLSGGKLGKFDLNDAAAAESAAKRIRNKALRVVSVEKKQVKRHPYAPFITSTLQQEASRKLGLSASETMRTAQRLYEGVTIGGETVGLITYMRTDGTTLSGDAIASLRDVIGKQFGDAYVPDAPRQYTSKAKNAQEAHEAIRPTDASRLPASVTQYLSPIEARLYDLIWTRAIASQMESAVLNQVSADISDGTDDVILRAAGSTVHFDGFLKLYEEGRDTTANTGDDDEKSVLPPLKQEDALRTDDVLTEQHFTEPPPRFSEASLVKKLEEEGIGRPSTYASILQVLQDRQYVRLESKRFVPEDRGRLVTSFLTTFFPKYVDYAFTASMEEELDAISDGHVAWKEALRQFWTGFRAAIDAAMPLKIAEVIDALDAELGVHFFPVRDDGTDPRVCPSCHEGRLGLRLGKDSPFIGCNKYPECKYTRPLTLTDDPTAGLFDGGNQKELGAAPTGETVTLRRGPYGLYVQLGDGEKPKRSSLPKGMDPASVDLERALKLLALPRLLGTHPETNLPISAGLGRFGPYLKHGDTFKSLKADDDVLEIGMNRAVQLLAEPAGKGGRFGRPTAEKLRELGNHPVSGVAMDVFKGRYGPYIKYEDMFVSLPKGVEPQDLTPDMAIDLIAKKQSVGGGKKKAPARKSKAAAKTSAKKAPAKKPAAKKATTKAKGKTKKS